MSLLPYYLPLITGSGFHDDASNEMLVNRIKSQRPRGHSMAPESMYVSTLRRYGPVENEPRSLVTRVRSLSPAREIYEDIPSSLDYDYVEPYSTKQTLGSAISKTKVIEKSVKSMVLLILARLTDVLGRGDDSWLDRYVSDVHAARPSKPPYLSPAEKQFRVKRRFLPSANYIYGKSLPGFYRYPREHHWSQKDPARYGYCLSTPPNGVSRNLEETLGPKGWDWRYPYRSYTSNFRPCYLHYPSTSYLYPKNF